MSSKKLSVSVVIPNYNGEKLLEKNLPKIIQAVGESEIIVVDDASTDNSVDWIKKNYPNIIVVKHKTNQRFAAACNSGFRIANAEVVVLLNNDVEPNKNFLPPLLKHFDNSDVFAVGCAEKESPESGELAGRGCGNFQRGMMIHWRCKQQIFGNSLWVSGGSGAFRKSIWNEMGGMDELFKPAYDEDRDICYRALKRGYRVIFDPDSLVFHRHETTNKSELGSKNMAVGSYKNQFVIVWKNVTSKSMLLQHLVWLPYQLIIGGLKTKGLLVSGFLQAMWLLPDIYKKRKNEGNVDRLNDEQVFESIYS